MIVSTTIHVATEYGYATVGWLIDQLERNRLYRADIHLEHDELNELTEEPLHNIRVVIPRFERSYIEAFLRDRLHTNPNQLKPSVAHPEHRTRVGELNVTAWPAARGLMPQTNSFGWVEITELEDRQ